MLERRSSLVLPVLCILALATGPQQASAAFIQQKFFVVQKPAVRLQQLTNFVDPSSRFPKSNKALKWLKRHLNSILQSVSLIFRNTIALQTSTELTYLETRLISQTLVSAAFPDSFSLDTRWREAHPIIVDFDKDGDSDWVAVAYNDTHTQIFWVPNNGQGGFSAPVRIGPPTQGTEGRFSSDVAPSTFAVGDLDRDGFYDVVVLQRASSRTNNILLWYKNRGDNINFDATSFFDGISINNGTIFRPFDQADWDNAFGFTLCDFDSDGDLDVVYGFFFSNDDRPAVPLSLSILENRISSSTAPSWGQRGLRIPVGIMDKHDGDAPPRGFQWRHQASFGGSNCWRNSRNEAQLPFSLQASGRNGVQMVARFDRTALEWSLVDLPQLGNRHYESLWGDFNGDGLPDVVSAIGNPPLTIPIITIWFAKENNSFSSSSWTLPWAITFSQLSDPFIYPYDINRDGLLDLIVAGVSRPNTSNLASYPCGIYAVINQGENGIPFDELGGRPNPFNPPVVVDVVSRNELRCESSFMPFAVDDFDGNGAPDILLLSGIGSRLYSVSLCGNGQRNEGEECDFNDVTLRNGTCSQECTCQAPYKFDANSTSCVICGNGVIDAGEDCDISSTNNTLSQGCTQQCSCARPDWIPDARVGVGCTRCGNGKIDQNEICEPSINGSSCDPVTCQCAGGFSLESGICISVAALQGVANIPAIAVPSVIAVLILIAAIIVTTLVIKRARRRSRALKALALPAINFSALSPAVADMMSIDSADIKLEKEIGRGAYGVVYKGRWKKVDVAVKKAANMTQEQLEDFIDEAVFMIKNVTPHKNLVQFYGAALSPVPIIVMEFLERGSLSSLLEDQNVLLSSDQMIQLMISAGEGLAHLHGLNVIHRDIAARNILLSNDLEPKLADFGMSRKLSDSNEGTTASTVGPIRWMAPESIGSLKYSAKSDVWSFGCLCAEILTRKQPHPEVDDLIALAVAIRDSGRTPLLPSACPEWLKILLEQHIWNYDADKRPDMSLVVACMKKQSLEPLGVKLVKKKSSRRWHGSKAPSRLKNTYTSIQAAPESDEERDKVEDEKKRI